VHTSRDSLFTDRGRAGVGAVAIRLAIEADNVKAEDIVVLHVEEICSWASYFVIITARSR
jgi:ribosomal silencing factor RsfS